MTIPFKLYRPPLDSWTLFDNSSDEAVRETILDHERTGDPLVIWRNGKVALVPANQLLKKSRKAASYKHSGRCVKW